MNTTEINPQAGADQNTSAKPARSAVVGLQVAPLQREPQEGGSYTRTPETGEIVPNAPAPAEQPVQE